MTAAEPRPAGRPWLRSSWPACHELDDAHRLDDYTIREWVDAPGLQYVPVGSQMVVVETAGRPVVIAGDTAVFHAELDEPSTEGQRLVRALGPDAVWLSHEHEPWRPQHGEDV